MIIKNRLYSVECSADTEPHPSYLFAYFLNNDNEYKVYKEQITIRQFEFWYLAYFLRAIL